MIPYLLTVLVNAVLLIIVYMNVDSSKFRINPLEIIAALVIPLAMPTVFTLSLIGTLSERKAKNEQRQYRKMRSRRNSL